MNICKYVMLCYVMLCMCVCMCALGSCHVPSLYMHSNLQSTMRPPHPVEEDIFLPLLSVVLWFSLRACSLVDEGEPPLPVVYGLFPLGTGAVLPFPSFVEEDRFSLRSLSC